MPNSLEHFPTLPIMEQDSFKFNFMFLINIFYCSNIKTAHIVHCVFFSYPWPYLVCALQQSNVTPAYRTHLRPFSDIRPDFLSPLAQRVDKNAWVGLTRPATTTAGVHVWMWFEWLDAHSHDDCFSNRHFMHADTNEYCKLCAQTSHMCKMCSCECVRILRNECTNAAIAKHVNGSHSLRSDIPGSWCFRFRAKCVSCSGM